MDALRKSLAVAIAIGVLGTSACAAKQQEPAQPAQQAQAEQKSDAKDEPASEPKSEPKSSDKKEKKKKKGGDVDTFDATLFSDRVANDVLGQIRDGLEGHSERLLLSAFDADKMSGYLQFEEQIERMFRRSEAFRVNFRISQTTIEGPKGVVLVNVEMEEIGRGTGNPVRRREQVRFELERGRKGWKVVDFSPRSILM